MLHPPEKDRQSLRRRRSKGSIVGGGTVSGGASSMRNSSSSTDTAATAADRPNHAAPIVLLCIHNSLRMNPQLQLCPPGRARRELQALLRQKPLALQSFENLQEAFQYPQQLLQQQPNVGPMEPEDTEDASSADEDELLSPREAVSALTIDNRNAISNEPLYLPAGMDPATTKLPFNRRKLVYFDSISAQDRQVARFFLKQQYRRSQQRHALQLTQQLKQLQNQERRKLGKPALPLQPATPLPGFTQLETQMTLALSAALLLESLGLQPKESLPGMAQCYDGIVAAGTALLEASDSQAEILLALEPLLITSLDQHSGQVIQELARLRNLCATARYRRRFVQRVAPLWIRKGAPWCLQHQQDMPAICAAAELILDTAPTHIFRKGWHERGRSILQDSQRAQTLNSAAQQLRYLADNKPVSQLWEAPLDDWEVHALLGQIKVSISSALQTDWSKVSAQAEVPRPSRRYTSPMAPRSPTRPLVLRNAPQSPTPPPPIDVENNNNNSAGIAGRATSPPPPELSPFLPRSPRSPSGAFPAMSSNAMPQPPLSPRRNTISVAGAATATASPLSPSSVGTSASAEIVAYRPTVSQTVGATVTNYRLLTSTAAERKRTVAACRALRAQIQRFEDAFIQLHGRPPKGNAERAPLATTYTQYREWKRAIRADAACRIQALVRGAQTRTRLLKSGLLPSSIILKRPARSSFTSTSSTASNSIVMPVVEGPSASSSFPTPTLAPQWASTVVRRQPVNLDELQARKRELKRQLKQYDMNFARRHGRMPVKAEKEPIRHLYEQYNALKTQIQVAESTARTEGVTPVASPTTVTPPSSTGTSLSKSSGRPVDSSRVPSTVSDNSSTESSPVRPRRSIMDLHTLKQEKSQLHQMLRSYEREFYEEHRRQVSSFSDIRPVASQYRRYKEIKRAIAALQGNH